MSCIRAWPWAVLICLVAVLAAAGGAAQPSGARSGGKLLRLAPGDQVAVPGTSLRCAVSASSGPTTIVCGVGTAQSPRAGSYSFAVADTALLVLKASATSTPVQVKRVPEPAGPSATYPGPATGGKTYSAPVGTVATVGGTHIFCAVERLQGKTYVTCGPADGSARFFVKSYIGAVSEKDLVVIRKLDQKRTAMILTRHQP